MRPPTAPECTSDITATSYLTFLLQQREFLLNMQLGQAMQSVFGDRQAMFNTWMYKSSDTIQSAAVAYGERIVAEWCLDTLHNKTEKDNKEVMEKIISLYLVHCVNINLDFFLINKLLTVEQGAMMKSSQSELVKWISPHLMDIVDSFGIPDQLLFAPIANEWETFNAGDNQGEIHGNSYF